MYFPNIWDNNYDALLEMNDTGETPKDGSLLYTKYDKGIYIYTGLSFEVKDNPGSNSEDTKAPFTGSWNKLYGIVFSFLVVLIILFYTFTKVFE
ncbi:MAG: hypothetical protein P8Y79_15370 [Ignavibacteriaceae bacterium]